MDRLRDSLQLLTEALETTAANSAAGGDPKDSAGPLLAKARVLMKMENDSAALAAVNDAIRIHPNYATAHKLRARINSRMRMRKSDRRSPLSSRGRSRSPPSVGTSNRRRSSRSRSRSRSWEGRRDRNRDRNDRDIKRENYFHSRSRSLSPKRSNQSDRPRNSDLHDDPYPYDDFHDDDRYYRDDYKGRSGSGGGGGGGGGDSENVSIDRLKSMGVTRLREFADRMQQFEISNHEMAIEAWTELIHRKPLAQYYMSRCFSYLQIVKRPNTPASARTRALAAAAGGYWEAVVVEVVVCCAVVSGESDY